MHNLPRMFCLACLMFSLFPERTSAQVLPDCLEKPLLKKRQKCIDRLNRKVKKRCAKAEDESDDSRLSVDLLICNSAHKELNHQLNVLNGQYTQRLAEQDNTISGLNNEIFLLNLAEELMKAALENPAEIKGLLDETGGAYGERLYVFGEIDREELVQKLNNRLPFFHGCAQETTGESIIFIVVSSEGRVEEPASSIPMAEIESGEKLQEAIAFSRCVEREMDNQFLTRSTDGGSVGVVLYYDPSLETLLPAD